MFAADEVPNFDLPEGIDGLPAALTALAQSMRDFDIEAMTRVPDIRPIELAQAPEVTLLEQILNLQTIQSRAMGEMAEGIKVLALRARKEDQRTWLLIGLTVVIAVLTAALLVATIG